MGTFGMQSDEKGNKKFCLIVDGTIEIKENGDGSHTIRCDLTDENGYSVTCDWTGTIEDFAVIESVESTLTEDLVFNPTQCTEIYFLGDYYYTGAPTYTITLADDDEVLAIDLCTVSGDVSALPTGTYTVSSSHLGGTVSPGRVTLTYAEPSVYVKYDLSTGSAIDMAPIFNGTLTISQSGSEYTFEYEFYDDFNRNDESLQPHKISGSWTGEIPEIVDYYAPAALSAKKSTKGPRAIAL